MAGADGRGSTRGPTEAPRRTGFTTPATPETYTATFEALPPKTIAFGALTASKSLTSYGERPTITGKLSASGGSVAGKQVTLLRSTDGGSTWTADGAATYNASAGTYTAVASPTTQNALFQMRFAGDSAYEPATSQNLSVRSQAALAQPGVPSAVKKNTAFTVYGNLFPYHSGYTRLYFYRYTSGGWKPYGVGRAPNSAYSGYARYSLSFKVPYAGYWFVRAAHGDADHAPTLCPIRGFRVY